MKKKQYVTLAVVLIGAALIGIAGWAYAKPAAASPESSRSAQQTSKNHDSLDKEHRVTGKHRYSHLDGRDNEGRDNESKDRKSVV